MFFKIVSITYISYGVSMLLHDGDSAAGTYMGIVVKLDGKGTKN